MMPSESASALQQFLGDRRIDVETSALDEIIRAALEFYGTVSASGLAPVRKADMLLFQFGVYDWGSGEHFQIGITRQFIIDGEKDDDAISQLHCTLFYAPTTVLRSIGRGNRWCESRDELSEFRKFVLSGNAYLTALPLPIERRRIAWEQV
jgi:hypothetical protein